MIQMAPYGIEYFVTNWVTQSGLLNHILKNMNKENKMNFDNTEAPMTFKLTNQALGAVMMALQESLLNEIDIVPILRGFELVNTEEGLVVTNPPTVRVSYNRIFVHLSKIVILLTLASFSSNSLRLRGSLFLLRFQFVLFPVQYHLSRSKYK